MYGLGLLSRIDASGQRRVYHFDRQGSTVALTDGAGAVADGNSYDPFGQVLGSAAPSANPFLFSGSQGVAAELDGLLFARARFLEPSTGKFIARDPMASSRSNTQAANRYSYAMNRPLVMSDASGMTPVFQASGSSDLPHGSILDLATSGSTAMIDVPVSRQQNGGTGQAALVSTSGGSGPSGGFLSKFSKNGCTSFLWCLPVSLLSAPFEMFDIYGAIHEATDTTIPTLKDALESKKNKTPPVTAGANEFKLKYGSCSRITDDTEKLDCVFNVGKYAN